MRVLLVARQFFPYRGGIESSTLTLAQQLKGQGIDVDIVTLNRRLRGKSAPLPGKERIQGLGVYRVPSLSGQYALPMWRPPRKGYDIVHFHGIDGFLESWHLFGHRLSPAPVLTTHGLIFHTRRLYRLKEWYLKCVFPSRVHGVALIASSVHDQRHLQRVGLQSIVIPNPVQPLAQFGIPKRDIDLLYLGRIAEHKGIPHLLATFQSLRQRRPGTVLVLAGEDWDGTLHRLSPLPAGVRWLGAVDDRQKTLWHHRAKIIVFPSQSEGFGIGIVEAQSIGSLVVAQDIAAYRELVRHEINGYLTDYADAAKSARLIHHLLDQDFPVAEVRAAARVWARRFDPALVTSKIVNVYDLAQSRQHESRPAGGVP